MAHVSGSQWTLFSALFVAYMAIASAVPSQNGVKDRVDVVGDGLYGKGGGGVGDVVSFMAAQRGMRNSQRRTCSSLDGPHCELVTGVVTPGYVHGMSEIDSDLESPSGTDELRETFRKVLTEMQRLMSKVKSGTSDSEAKAASTGTKLQGSSNHEPQQKQHGASTSALDSGSVTTEAQEAIKSAVLEALKKSLSLKERHGAGGEDAEEEVALNVVLLDENGDEADASAIASKTGLDPDNIVIIDLEGEEDVEEAIRAFLESREPGPPSDSSDSLEPPAEADED